MWIGKSDFGEGEMGENWAYTQWAGVSLGDERLNTRAAAIAKRAMNSDERSIPSRSEDWAATKATYRFFDNPKVSHEALQEWHWTLVRNEALAHDGPVLWVQDGSELLFNAHDFLAGCGPTADACGNGMLIHTCLGIKWSGGVGITMGIGYQTVWTRGSDTMLPWPAGTKESAVWRETLQALGRVHEGETWISVCDRGCDAYEFFAAAVGLDWDFVVRVNHDRKAGTEDGCQGLLTYVRSLESWGQRKLSLRSRGNDSGRDVELQYAAATAVLPVPHGMVGSPLSLNAVRIWGEDLEWILLTTLPTDSLEDLIRIGSYYEHRWMVEEYHKFLKTGLKIEKSQLRTAQRISNLLGILGVVAV